MSTKIITERLILDLLSKNDSKFIFELVNTDGWLKFIGNRHVNSEIEAKAYIQKILGTPNVTYWIAKLKEDQTAIGIVTFLKRDYLQYPDIGFAFLPAYTTKGYAYEATKAVLYKVIHQEQHLQIFAITNENNSSAIKLLKRLTLQFDKQIEVEDEILELYSVSTINTAGKMQTKK